MNVANLNPLHTVMHTRKKVPGDPIRQIRNDTEIPMIVLV